jgi:hypothetical protein
MTSKTKDVRRNKLTILLNGNLLSDIVTNKTNFPIRIT